MKKALFLLFSLIILLSGCKKPVTDFPVPSEAPAVSHPIAVDRSLPFLKNDFDSVIGEFITLEKANELFGEPVRTYSYIQQADLESFISIEYQNSFLLLSTGNEKNNYMVKQLILKNHSDINVRNITIGSSKDEVIESFPDLSLKYQDEEDVILYTISDINPELGRDSTYHFVGGLNYPTDGAFIGVIFSDEREDILINCSEVISYTYVDRWNSDWNSYGSVYFFLKDGKVTSMMLYKFTDPE